MRKELRVLVIEDMATDVELIVHELQRAGVHFRAKWVESEGQFLEELAHHPPDVILSDHGVPGFDGFSALALAHQRRPEIPFIFVTGAHGDEVAVETLKHGADDYVLKSRLHLLAPAIQRVMGQAAERAERERAEAKLRRSEELLRLLAEATDEQALLTLDLEGRIAGWEYGTQRMLGYAGEEMLGSDFSRLFPREEQSKARQALKTALRDGKCEEGACRAARKGGAEFPAALTLHVLRGPGGEPDGLACVLHNLTRRKQMEDEALARADQLSRQRNTQVEADYRELQELAYVISCDLRLPLRNIDNFAELLQRSTAGQFEPKGRAALQTIAEGARQMSRLVDELLTYCRIGRTEMNRLEFNLGEIAREVLREQCRETEGRTIEWVVGNLPQVFGDPALLWLVLHNLVSNAIKFTRPRPQARVEIGSTVTEREVIIFVSDNGVGFDPRHRAKLFGVFQRLKTAPELEGLGIGLANVRRIVQRHGGRAWAEGALDKGASFYFSLPRPLAGGQPEPCEVGTD